MFMNTSMLINALVAQGCAPARTAELASQLEAMDASLVKLLERWVETKEEGDFAAHGYSVKDFVEKWQLTYPAALLTMNWLLKEPEEATVLLKQGIR